MNTLALMPRTDCTLSFEALDCSGRVISLTGLLKTQKEGILQHWVYALRVKCMFLDILKHFNPKPHPHSIKTDNTTTENEYLTWFSKVMLRWGFFSYLIFFQTFQTILYMTIPSMSDVPSMWDGGEKIHQRQFSLVCNTPLPAWRELKKTQNRFKTVT